MTAGHLVMLTAGIALAAHNTWQHLGRTPAARSWTSTVQGDLKERSVLIARPLLVVVLVGGALTGVVDTSGPGAVVALVVGLALLLLIAYLILPLPIPGFARPGWSRNLRSARG